MAITVRTITTDANATASLKTAREDVLTAAREAAAEGRVIDLSIELDHRVYALDETLVFSVKENPELKNVRLTLRNAPDMSPVVSSQKPIDAPFVPVEGTPYYMCRLPKDETGKYPRFHGLYVDVGRGNAAPLRMASTPEWRNPFPLLPEERRGEKELEGIYVPYRYAEALARTGVAGAELWMYIQWEHTVLHVAGVDLERTRTYEGETYALLTFGDDFSRRYTRGTHFCNNTGNRPTFLRNTPAFLSAPGEYAYSAETGELFVYPTGRIETSVFYYAALENLIVLEGMEGVTIEGVTFTAAECKYICENGYHGALTNVETYARRLQQGVIFGRDLRDLTVRNCTFKGVSTNAIELFGRNVTVNIYDNKFVNVGMSGVFIGDYIGKWALPSERTATPEELSEYESRVAYNVSVINNYFEHIGYDYPNSSAVYVCFVDRLRILHNTMKDLAFNGIACGFHWDDPADFYPGEGFNLRDTEIAYNSIHDYMSSLRDGAAIYVTGANAHLSYEGRINSMHDNYASLHGTNDRDRRGYYLDGGATNWDVYNNVIDGCALPLFTQYHVKTQYTHHVRSHHIYSTTPVEDGNHVPERDTLMSDIFVEKDFETLCLKYPEARAISENAGCSLDTRG